MKATTIQLTPRTRSLFEEYHRAYVEYNLAKQDMSDTEADMKDYRDAWQEATPELEAAPGGAQVRIVSEHGEPLVTFSKARVVNDLDKRAYIDAVLTNAGVDETTRTTITGMLSATKLLDEITIGLTLAKKQHPDELAEHNSPDNKGPRTVKFL